MTTEPIQTLAPLVADLAHRDAATAEARLVAITTCLADDFAQLEKVTKEIDTLRAEHEAYLLQEHANLNSPSLARRPGVGVHVQQARVHVQDALNLLRHTPIDIARAERKLADLTGQEPATVFTATEFFVREILKGVRSAPQGVRGTLVHLRGCLDRIHAVAPGAPVGTPLTIHQRTEDAGFAVSPITRRE